MRVRCHFLFQLLFYTVRASLVLLKLYLDSRMLHYFVRSMHASNSLLASTFNQCSSIILAVGTGAHGHIRRRRGRVRGWIRVVGSRPVSLCLWLCAAGCIAPKGICGLLLFSESLPSSWMVGVAFIIVGV